MEVFWKYSQVDPYQYPTCLTQFVGAYASAAIDKTTEVQQLFEEKDERVL